MKFKDIHIGQLIEKGVVEDNIDIFRISNFLKCTEEEIKEMYQKKNLDTDILLKWCKLLEYDFFRLYSQHLILYAPPALKIKNKKKNLPQFRKNIYTKEIVDFILEQIYKEEMTRQQVIERYGIPKTTLNKWLQKDIKDETKL
ncbi:transposase [Chryseobacterium sp. MYb7]|uniref:transposase n=1 Tax=Chryseobacterium sp. MYb7 TaxID=1827290 RepID=UPI000D00D6FB|nr:transposase [Chryseobacterium sp. MYb7]PRB02776.1 transposase [Chryseobacterium sp. MYb7]